MFGEREARIEHCNTEKGPNQIIVVESAWTRSRGNMKIFVYSQQFDSSSSRPDGVSILNDCVRVIYEPG